MQNLLLTLCFIYIPLFPFIGCIRQRIPIGVILEPGKDDASLTVLKYGLWIQDQRRNWPKQFRLEIVTETAALDDATQLDKAMCRLLQQGVYAVVSPMNPLSYQILTSYSNEFELPLLSPSFPEVPRDVSPRFAVSVQPSITRAVLDLIRYYKWNDFVYLYDDSQGPERLQQIFQLGYRVLNVKLLGILKAVSPEQVNQYFRRMEVTQKHRAMHIILDTDTSLATNIIIRHVHDIHVSKHNFHFLLTKPVLDEFWISHHAEFAAVNVTGFSVLSAGSFETLQRTWMNLSPKEWPGAGTRLNVSSFLYYDAAFVLGEAFRKMLQTKRYNPPPTEDMSFTSERRRDCLDSASQPLPDGALISQYMRQGIDTPLMTGKVEIDSIGQRKNVQISVTEVAEWQHRLVGIWSDTFGLKLSQNPGMFSPIALPRREEKKMYKIVSIMYPPFLMLRRDQNSSDSMNNDRFEGYTKDLIDLLAKELKFDYQISLVSDGQYGRYDKLKGEWTGMIGEVIRGKADMAVADLSITPERLRVVDFTESHLTCSLSILMKNPQFVLSGSSGFFFVDAFSSGVWICILASIILLVALFHTMTIFTGAPDNIEAASGIWGKKFTVIGSTWFILGSGMLQGTGVYPRSMASRILGAAWWCFTLVLLALYIASTTTQLSMSTDGKNSPQLTSLLSLSLESIITESVKNGWPRIAIYKGGKMHEYVRHSSLPFLKEYEAYLNEHPELFMRRITEGVRNVRASKGDYATIVESSQGDFFSRQKPCDLVAVHDVIDTFYNGIAVPLGSPLKFALNAARERLQERGELNYLRQKWFYDKSSCEGQLVKNGDSTGRLFNLSGLLYFLLAGIAVTAVVGVFQYFWRARKKNERRQKLSFDEVAMGQSLPLPPPELLRDSPEEEDNAPIDGWAERKLVPTSFSREHRHSSHNDETQN